MRLACFIVITLLVSFIAFGSFAEANLLSDPSFENGGDAIVIKDGPWTWSGGSNGQAFYNEDVALRGTKSAKVVMWGGSSNDYAYFVEEFEGIDTSMPYKVDANFLNNSAAQLNTDGTAAIQVKWFNSLGTLMQLDESAAFDNTYALDQWHNISVMSSAPAMATKAAVVLVGKSNAGYAPDSTVYVDDMSLEAVPEPASIVMLASGLLGLLGISRKKRG
jgi:hypothetical protein